MKFRTKALVAASTAVLTMAGVAGMAQAQTAAPAPAADAATAPAGAAPAAAAAPAAPTFSIGMDGPIVINPTPFTLASGPLLGSITINGALTGMALVQNHPGIGDYKSDGDLTNGQILIEKTDGVFQFFVDAGAYSFPDLGTPYTPSAKATNNNFGAIPMAFIKVAPSANFSIEAGKLPTLLGAEYNFTFENTNIERGLLWNQENLVNRGVQLNYTQGPVTFNFSVNDGFYSNTLSYITGAATWTINGSNTLEFSAGGNTKKTTVSNSATPQLLNNSSIFDLILTHTQGQWTVQPYLQYTTVPSIPLLGTGKATTFGGALFVTYAFPATAKIGDFSLSGFSLPARFEYISSTGSVGSNAPSLLYGQGSKAWSITVTPTYQYKIYFIRAELSYVGTSDTTPGFVFGQFGTAKSQTRGLIETGVLF